MKNTFGNTVTMTIFGESHGPAVGAVLDGLAAGLPVFDIEQLQKRAEAIVGVPDPIRYKDRIVGVVLYRDNTVIDVIRQIDEDA